MGSHRWILNEWHPAARKSPVTFVHRVRESGVARSTPAHRAVGRTWPCGGGRGGRRASGGWSERLDIFFLDLIKIQK
jgi:hypothetical protein